MSTGDVGGTGLSYGVLGPLEVRHGDAALTLADDRQRALLELLLLTPNRPVLAWTIVDELFADEQDRPTFDLVWSEVSRLRDRLRVNGDPAPISQWPGGYVLTLEPEQLDASRFERLVDDGRALRSAGDPIGAAAAAREALGLWRGDPLTDLCGGAVAQAEIRRLDELRGEALQMAAAPGPATEPVPDRHELLSGLIGRAAADGLVGLIGPSRAGKSTILRAGLLPLLAQGILPGSQRWRQVVIEPGPSPVTALQQAIGGPLVDAMIALPQGERLVIVADGLEDVATDGAERARFLDLLVVAASDPSRRALVLVTLSADAYGRLGDHPVFARRLSAAHVFVGPAGTDDPPILPEPSTRPAGVTTETDALAAEPAPAVADHADAPPEHRLTERRRGDRRTGERRAGRRDPHRRPKALPALAILVLGLAAVAGAVAMANHHRPRRIEQTAQHSRPTASPETRVLLADEVGAEAARQPRLDRAMLLARAGVALDDDPRTESALLGTLLRSPAALSSVWLPHHAVPGRIALSPDGRLLAISEDTGQLRLDDARTLQPLRTFHDELGSDAPVFSPDGRWLAYLGRSGTGQAVIVRDASSFAIRARLPFDARRAATSTQDDPQSALAFSPDGNALFYGYWTTDANGAAQSSFIDRWPVTGGPPQQVTLGSGSLDYDITHDGEWLQALVGDLAVTLDANTLAPLASVTLAGVDVRPGRTAAFSPDGATAVIGGADGQVQFADVTTGAVRAGIGGDASPIQTAQFTPDGRSAVTTGDDGHAIVWDPKTGREQTVLSGQPGELRGAAITADGRTLYTSSPDGNLVRWALRGRGAFERTFALAPRQDCCSGTDPRAPELATSADGHWFAAATGARGITIASTASLSPVAQITLPATSGAPTALALSPDGRTLAIGAGGGSVQLWSVSHSPRLIRSLTGLASAPGAEGAPAVSWLAFSTDGSRLAGAEAADGTSGGEVVVWATQDGTTTANWSPPVASAVSAIAWGPSGRTLAVGTRAGTVALVNAPTGAATRTMSAPGAAQDGPITALAYAPGGTLAAGSSIGTVQLWGRTGRLVGSPRRADVDPIAGLAFSPDGSQLLSTGGGDGATRLWFTAGLSQAGTTIDPAPGEWATARFVAGGREILLLHDDGTGMRLPATPAAWARHACSVAGRALTVQEWTRYVHAPGQRKVCVAGRSTD